MHWLADLSRLVWDRVVGLRIDRIGAFHVLPGDIIIRNGNYEYATRDQIQKGEITAHDVLLPVPGTEVSVPENETSIIYESVMQELGLPRSFEKWKCRDLSLEHHGSYRPMLVKPISLCHKLSTGPQDAILDLRFSLPPQCDLTMMLRELCKYEENTPLLCPIKVPTAMTEQALEETPSPVNGELKWRHLTDSEKKTYNTQLSPRKKKIVHGSALLRGRLTHKIFHRILPLGTQRWSSRKIGKKI